MAGLEGTRLGAYELIQRTGAGGMAEVYRARQLTAFNREVAVKVIRAHFTEDPSFRERFLREAQAITKLSHPNILPLIEFGEENGVLYLVMPLAREGTLRDLLTRRNGSLPLEEAIPLFTQLCDAVQYAHEQGIIHRDIKPHPRVARGLRYRARSCPDAHHYHRGGHWHRRIYGTGTGDRPDRYA